MFEETHRTERKISMPAPQVHNGSLVAHGLAQTNAPEPAPLYQPGDHLDFVMNQAQYRKQAVRMIDNRDLRPGELGWKLSAAALTYFEQLGIRPSERFRGEVPPGDIAKFVGGPCFELELRQYANRDCGYPVGKAVLEVKRQIENEQRGAIPTR